MRNEPTVDDRQAGEDEQAACRIGRHQPEYASRVTCVVGGSVRGAKLPQQKEPRLDVEELLEDDDICAQRRERLGQASYPAPLFLSRDPDREHPRIERDHSERGEFGHGAAHTNIRPYPRQEGPADSTGCPSLTPATSLPKLLPRPPTTEPRI